MILLIGCPLYFSFGFATFTWKGAVSNFSHVCFLTAIICLHYVVLLASQIACLTGYSGQDGDSLCAKTGPKPLLVYISFGDTMGCVHN